MLYWINPNLLAIIAAVFISIARTIYRAALSRLSPLVTNLVMTVVTALCGVGFYHLEGSVPNWPLNGLLWFAAVGFLGSFTGRYLGLVGMNLVGLARSSVVSQTSLVWSALLAVFVLGEHMSVPVGVGTLAIMCGTALLVAEGSSVPARHIPLRYYLVPLLGAALFGVAHMASKFGMRAIPSAPLGTATSSTTGVVLMLLFLPFSGEGRTLRDWDPKGLAMVVVGAVFNALAAICFWSAMKEGNLVTVVPLNRLSLLLLIFFSWLFFRKQEAVNSRVVIGAVLSVLGAFAVGWG